MPHVYEPEFKKKIVRLHLEEGQTYKSLTQEYGVSKSAISKQVEEFSKECQEKVKADPTATNDADLMKENLRLRKDLDEVKLYPTFAKRLYFFVKESLNNRPLTPECKNRRPCIQPSFILILP